MKKVQITLTDIEEADTSKIEQSISQLSGVKNIAINPSSKTLTADCEEYIGEDQLISTIRQTGYQVADIFFEKSTEDEVIEEGDTFLIKQTEKSHDWLEKVVWSWVFAAPLVGILILEIFLGHQESWILRLLTLFLSLPVVFLMGWKIISSGVQEFISLEFDTNALITLSSVVAYGTGFLSLFLNVTDYSGVAGIMMAVFITGKYLEARVRGESEKEVKGLISLRPQSAKILVQGEEMVVPLSEIQDGDILIVLPGDHIAADGIVIKGRGVVDEGIITGDGTSKEKKQGDIILTGSVVQEGKLVIEVTSIGKDTTLSKMLGVIEGMQSTKFPIQRKINAITKVIVPTMIILSILSFVIWFAFTQDLSKALNTALAVLVIACPSSLALAIPTVLFIGSGIAARRGILVRNGESFQTLKEVKTIIFDKLGTVTYGLPEASYVTSLIKEKELLEIAASLARSQDPLLAQALLDRAGLRRYKQVINQTIVPGKGIEGEIDKKKVLLGNRKLMIEKSIALKGFGVRVQEYERSGKKALIVALNGKAAGVIAISDQLREEAISTITRLQRMKYNIILMTNEDERTAHALAKKLNISEIVSETSSNKLLEKIKELQSFGKVAFIASPGRNIKAINQSNVGIVIGSEDNIGRGTEDILLTKNSLSGVVEIAKLSQEVQRKTNQNLLWALGYNILAIPLAVMGLLHPLIAEIAMIASTLSIFMNANTLRAARIS